MGVNMSKMCPYIDYCYNRFGRQYTPDCDNTCDYAIKVKENKMLKEYLKRLAAETNSLHTLFEDWDN